MVLPNHEVELFYGNVGYSADQIVVLPEHIIIYDAPTASFHLLRKKDKLNLANLSLFDIPRIRTSRVLYTDNKSSKKPYFVLKSPFQNYAHLNLLDMYSLSDTSVYGGIIRIKKEYKLVKLYVHNDSLKLDLIDYNINKQFVHPSKKELKRKKLYFFKFYLQTFNKYVEAEGSACIIVRRSPLGYRKPIRTLKNTIRDSILNYNVLYVKKNHSDTFNLFYQNKSAVVQQKLGLDRKFGTDVWPNLFTSKDLLIMHQANLDSLIVFDKDLKRIFTSNLRVQTVKKFPDIAKLDTVVGKTQWFSIKLLKDEFTEKLYVLFRSKNKGFVVSELNFNYKTQKPEFRYLREIKSSISIYSIRSINKGIMYMASQNNLLGNNYIYTYDLYKGLPNKDKVLEINFAKVINQNRTKGKKPFWISKYEKHSLLSNKERKKYFRKLKRDTISFPQGTHIDLLKSVHKAVLSDSLDYAFTHLFIYSGLMHLEMDDDIRTKNNLFFEDLKEDFDKETASQQLANIIKNFDSFDVEMYKNKMIVRTPDGLFFYIFQIKDLWYLDLEMKRICTEEI